MTDLIDRQAAIDEAVAYIEEWNNAKSEYHKKEITRRFQNLLSAQQNLQPTCNQLATDCISRQVAIDLYEQFQPYIAVKAVDFGKALEQLPSAQPEIIRCKDCEKYRTMFCVMDIWTEDVTIYKAKPDDFCSRAERREDG